MASFRALWLCTGLLAAVSITASAAENYKQDEFGSGIIWDSRLTSYERHIDAVSNAKATGYVNTSAISLHMNPSFIINITGSDPANATNPYAYEWRTNLTMVHSDTDANVGAATMFHQLIISEANIQRMRVTNRSIQVFHTSLAGSDANHTNDCTSLLGTSCINSIALALLVAQNGGSLVPSQVPLNCSNALRRNSLHDGTTADVSTTFIHADLPSRLGALSFGYFEEYIRFLPAGAFGTNSFAQRAALFYTTKGLTYARDPNDLETLLGETIVLAVTEYGPKLSADSADWTSITCHRIRPSGVNGVAKSAAAVARPAMASVVALTLVAAVVLSC